MARYDYGFRGTRHTMEPRFASRYATRYAEDYQLRDPRQPNFNRVTAPYNMDYVRDRGEEHTLNWNRYAGDWPGQMIGEGEYRYPYITRGGTYTYRGSIRPVAYDYRDFGPNFGGRYPDEL